MSLPDKEKMAAIAVTRFGLGPRPGELDAARADPRGWLKGQIQASGADQPATALPNSAERIVTYREMTQDRKALQEQQAKMAGQPEMAAKLAEQMKALQGRGEASGVQDETLARVQIGRASCRERVFVGV